MNYKQCFGAAVIGAVFCGIYAGEVPNPSVRKASLYAWLKRKASFDRGTSQDPVARQNELDAASDAPHKKPRYSCKQPKQIWWDPDIVVLETIHDPAQCLRYNYHDQK